MELLRTNPAAKVVAVASCALLLIYGTSRLFSEKQQQRQDQQEESPKKPAGIFNQGNTCFYGVSQCEALASIQSFDANLQQVIQRKYLQDQNEQLIIQLHSVIEKINRNHENVEVTNFLELISVVKKDLINFQQQDAHQLYSAIISSFDIVINKRKSIDLSASLLFSEENEEDQIANNLIGFTKSSLMCTKCQNQTTIKIHPFYDLSLEIHMPYITCIEAALLWYERKEKIQNWTCAKCSVDAHIVKLDRVISNLKGPNKQKLTEIALQIKNYLSKLQIGEDDLQEINEKFAIFVTKFEKTYAQMIGDFELQLVFAQISAVQTTVSKQCQITKYPKILVLHLKQLIIDPRSGEPILLRKPIAFQETLNIKTRCTTREYRLTSLLTHIGNEDMGHYFTFRKLNRKQDEWYMISDTDSRRCSLNRVKAYVPYMLFYQAQ